MKAKILIVGGGIMGTSIALHASQKTDAIREPVVLLERRELGAGSTGGSGAILRQLYADRLLALMARDSLREYSLFTSQTGRQIGFRRSGVMTIAGPDQPEWSEKIRRIASELEEHGLAVHPVEGDRIAELVPGLEVGPNTVGAWEPESGFVDPNRTVQAFAALARTYGAVTRLNVSLESIDVKSGRVVGARTSEGDYEVERIVIACGPWTNEILRTLDVDLPLRAICPENYFFEMPEAGGEFALAAQPRALEGLDPFGVADPARLIEPKTVGDTRPCHPVVIDLERDAYYRCEPGDARTRVGRIDYRHHPIVQTADELVDGATDEDRAWARNRLTARLPEYKGAPDAGDITSWYTLTPDAQPILGPVPGIEGLFIASGFSGHGFKLGPSIGEGMTQMLFDEPVTAFDPIFFSPARFDDPSKRDWTGCFGL